MIAELVLVVYLVHCMLALVVHAVRLPAEQPVIRSLCSVLSPSVCRCKGEILPMQLGARHHILYVGFWALNAARAEDMGGGGLYMGGGGGHGRGNVGGRLFKEGGGGAFSWLWPFRYPPGLPGANLHPESSIISKCKCRCGR